MLLTLFDHSDPVTTAISSGRKITTIPNAHGQTYAWTDQTKTNVTRNIYSLSPLVLPPVQHTIFSSSSSSSSSFFLLFLLIRASSHIHTTVMMTICRARIYLCCNNSMLTALVFTNQKLKQSSPITPLFKFSPRHSATERVDINFVPALLQTFTTSQ